MASAACFSTLVFMSSCSKDAITPTPESAVNESSNLRVGVLPSQGNSINEFKTTTLGLKNKGYFGKIDQVNQLTTKAGKFGFLVSTKSTESGLINSNPELKLDPLTRMYVVGEFSPSNPLKVGEIYVDENFENIETYFRTFILLEDGTITYGNVFHRAIPDGLSKVPKLWELKANSVDANGMSISITKQGTNPAVEYGIVLSSRQKTSDPINSVPTVADKKISAYNFTPGSYINYTPGNSLSVPIDFPYYELYYRPYVKLQNGSIIYGNVAYSNKRPKMVLK